MKNRIIGMLLFVVLMGGIAKPFITPAQPPKVLHACIVCNLITLIQYIPWSEWRSWGHHPRQIGTNE